MSFSPTLLNQLDAVGDWGLLATDADLVITGWNRWLERHAGLSAEEAAGRRLFDLFPDLPARGLDRYFTQALAGRPAILSQRLHKYLLPLPPPQGGGPERMQQSGRILPLIEGGAVCGTLAVIEDVTERVAREAQVLSRGKQQAALARSARSALAGHDVVDLCTESARRLADTLPADFAEVLELQPGDARCARLAGVGWPRGAPVVFGPAEAARTQVAASSDAPRVIGEAAELSGGEYDAQLRSLGVRSGLVVRIPGRAGRPFGLLGAYARTPRVFTSDEVQFLQALADIIGSAAERNRLEAELRVRADQLADADRRKDEFLAMLAHELRNPLAPVRNAVHILQMSCPADPLVARMAGMLGRQVGQMAHLVDDLLDVSRITRGKVTLRRERVLLAEIVKRAVEATRPMAESRRHELSVSVPPEPIVLDVDLTRLTQILSNLLNNAAKYTEEGGRIWVTAHREGDEAVVEVRDTGIGLAPAMIPRVFDLFAQEHHSLDRAQGGLGIGLTLVRSLVEMHGGSVEAQSEGAGRGSKFTVRLPVPPAGGAQPEGRDGPSPPAPLPRRVLIVDDNVDSAESLAELLSLSGHEVRTSHDGTGALQVAEAHRPDVILLDIGLPHLDGYEVARRLRQLPGFQSVTLIAMTGYGQDEDRRRSQEAGLDHHLVKPVGLEDIAALFGSPPAVPPSDVRD